MKKTRWDAFISHASEDKENFVKPLAELLNNNGVEVWYDEFTLRYGDSLSSSIDRGLSKSNYGIVVISKAFIKKRWTKRELRGLVAREMAGSKKRIIPIWYGVTQKEVTSFSPPLADKVAGDSIRQSISEIAFGIIEIVRPDISQNLTRKLIIHQMMEGTEKVYIPLSQLVKGAIKHVSLHLSLIQRIKIIHKIFFDELMPTPLEEVIDNFRRDRDPENEIQIWENMVLAYLNLTNNHKLELEQKREIFFALLLLSTDSLDEQWYSDFSLIKIQEVRDEWEHVFPK